MFIIVVAVFGSFSSLRCVFKLLLTLTSITNARISVLVRDQYPTSKKYFLKPLNDPEFHDTKQLTS